MPEIVRSKVCCRCGHRKVVDVDQRKSEFYFRSDGGGKPSTDPGKWSGACKSCCVSAAVKAARSRRSARKESGATPARFGFKICYACGDSKHVTEFAVNNQNKDGRTGMCLECYYERYKDSRVAAEERRCEKRREKKRLALADSEITKAFNYDRRLKYRKSTGRSMMAYSEPIEVDNA